MSIIRRLPVWFRSVVQGLLVAGLGILPWAMLTELNLRSDSWPWAAVIEIPVLLVTWWWLGGGGPPRSTSESRRQLLRAFRVGGPALRWSLIAGSGYAFTLIAVTVVGWQLSAPNPSVLAELEDLSSHPLTTTVPLLLVGSLVAGVIEEAAFRGYMQGPLETRYGATVAVGLVALVFAVSHLPNPAVVPFFALAATGWGVLAYCTRSILIPIAFHVLVDAAGWLWLVVSPDSATSLLMTEAFGDGPSATFLGWLAALTIAMSFTVWSMTRLVTVTRTQSA